MENIINCLFDSNKQSFSFDEQKEIINVIELLDKGKIRIAEKKDGKWEYYHWVKKAILLYFRIQKNDIINHSPGSSYWFDKIPNKFTNWKNEDFTNAKIRAVPISFARFGCYVAENVILMPSFLNIGAYVDKSTMIDSWVTVGSCAQIGKKCHISAGVTIGGVLEPIQENPVVIEDNCFIGAGSNILEGVVVQAESVIAAGTTITKSTKIINKETGNICYGQIPAGSVVISGSTSITNNLSANCAIIIKTIDAKTKSKTSINELLRDFS